MSIAWLALYTDDDPHPRLFDSLGGALNYLERFEQVPDEVLDTLSLELTRQVEAVASPPETRRRYRLTRHTSATTHPQT
ncbi:MAG: hypothetical protein U0Z75_08050 [Deinococcaceae bacterium]